MLRSLYFIFIKPYINYGLINWGCATKSSLEAVRKNVKKAVRLISLQNKSCHSQPLFEKLKILDFDKFYKFTIGKFMWNLSNGMLSISITSLFERSDKIISERENDFDLPTINTEAKKEVYFL